jgi:hypothetical protein
VQDDATCKKRSWTEIYGLSRQELYEFLQQPFPNGFGLPSSRAALFRGLKGTALAVIDDADLRDMEFSNFERLAFMEFLHRLRPQTTAPTLPAKRKKRARDPDPSASKVLEQVQAADPWNASWYGSHHVHLCYSTSRAQLGLFVQHLAARARPLARGHPRTRADLLDRLCPSVLARSG